MKQRWQLPAKLNWTLDVLGKRRDGFHELQSWFLALDWGDVLGFETLDSKSSSFLSLSGEHGCGIPADLRNLLLLAEKKWREAGGQAPSLHWQLEKRVPAGAGLGGGSSNAAAALQILQATASRPIPQKVCLELAQSLGSDVGFFFQRGLAELRGGRGETVLATGEPPSVWLVLALTGLHASTPAIFSELNAQALPEAHSVDPSSMTARQIPAKPTSNQLEEAAFKCLPGLMNIALRLREHGSFTMSGSGSTFFSACPSENLARKLERSIADLVPQVVVCQPLLYHRTIATIH